MQVRVFRNLTRDSWSIQTRTAGAWRTIAHAPQVAVAGATFQASEASRQRIVAKGQREVHAWVQGDLVAIHGAVAVAKWASPEIDAALAAAAAPSVAPLGCGVTYRPFERAGFYVRATGAAMVAAPQAHFTMETGCTV